ncbi:MAG TPA: adenylyl-sulfate kinase [Propionibacteriaceae bacterium]|nr:adenylyl-sulfate kinase [Propionibacteriaceae bacterium]
MTATSVDTGLDSSADTGADAGADTGVDTSADTGGTLSPAPGATVWLTGLPCAGKSTIAHALAARLRGRGRRVEVLDGDEVRPHLSQGLGFSRADRAVNVARIGWVAQLLARHGVLVLVPVIAPHADAREAVRRLHEERETTYLEVFVEAPLEVTAARDVKGMYARARAGTLPGFTGVDDEYEPPEFPDVRLRTADRAVEDSVTELETALTERGLL